MHSTGRVGQISAVACLMISGGMASAEGESADSGGQAFDDLSAKQIVRQLAGEWEGQIEVRSEEGGLSASVASMSARLGSHGSLEIYYEGFAFGEAGEGGLIFSAGERPNDGSMIVYDEFVGLEASARGSRWPDPESAEDSFRMAGRAESRSDSIDQIRTAFRRHSEDSWEIEFQSMAAPGEWETTLSLKLDRLPEGQRSAASEGLESSVILASLRNDAVVAGVETDD